jgi:hypothetical protein
MKKEYARTELYNLKGYIFFETICGPDGRLPHG